MTAKFDPNFAPYMEGEFTGTVLLTENPALGIGNHVVNRAKPFDVDVTWRTFGDLNPLWLTALSVASPNWVVTAYAEPIGPGTAVSLGSVSVPVIDGSPIGNSKSYAAHITVPAGTLTEENPGVPGATGMYRLAVTAFLDSALGGVGFDVIGYAEGPSFKVENPS